VSYFRKDEDKDKGTFYFEKETGSDRKARVRIGVPEWLESVLAGEGSIVNGPGSSLQNCPKGICIGGDNSGTAVVYNFTPPARRLSDDQRTLLTACLRLRPGKFSIAAIENNAEAYSYAQDWHDVLVAAGWEIEHKDIPINIFMIGGGMWTGMRASVHGTMIGTDTAYFVDGSPEKKFYDCVGGKAQIVLTVIPYDDIPTGSFRINISARE
jgi:hypothetical protein